MTATTTTAFSRDEYHDILIRSEIKLEYRAGEIYTMWGEAIEEREGQLVTAETGVPLFSPNNEILAMSGAKPDHNRLAVKLTAEFVQCLQSQGCEVFNNDQVVYIEACERETFPDITIVCAKAAFEKLKRGLYSLTNPDIIVEVLSDSTEAYDRGEKYDCYRTLESLKEYVLVSTKKRKIEVFARNTPFEWIQRIYNDDNPRVKIGNCEMELADIYRMVTFDLA